MKETVLGTIGKRFACIDDRLYSSFIEHMGRAVYTGIYEPGHPEADENGFRRDVLVHISALNLSYIRYPGGNFLSGYRWEDGIGPKENRPVRPELAWFALEPNEVGTNEFMEFLKLAGASPMLAVNLGTGTAQDAVNMLEYCNFPSGTYYSDLRIAQGYSGPHGVKLWCLGNEMDGPWQICAKTATEYGRIAAETAKMMKWLDPQIELVVCGSSYREMPTFGAWEREVLRHTYEHVDYLSLHTYYMNKDGDLPNFLASSVRMDAFIKEVAAICGEIKREKNSNKDIYLSFDEWNVWYHFQMEQPQPPKWIKARPIEEEAYNFADALVTGSMMITLINNADVVKIACLAQLVNVIAPIMTEPNGRVWLQTTYYPFYYACQYGRGTALFTKLVCPTYVCKTGEEVPYIDCAAVLNKAEDSVALFLVNKHPQEDIACALEMEELCCKEVMEWVMLSGYAPTDVNTADSQAVCPRPHTGAQISGKTLLFTLPALSWSMLRLRG